MAQTYTVKSGDTLSAIGAKYGVNYNQITGYKSGNPNLIYPGEVLTIPDASPSLPNASTPTFTDSNQVQNYTNGQQNLMFNNYTAPNTPQVQSLEAIKADITKMLPSEPAPTAPNLVETYKNLRSDSNVTTLESEVNDLTNQGRIIEEQLRINKASETAKPVAMNVIEGRISEETKQAQEQLDFINRQKAYKVDQLQSAYTNINTIMTLTQSDYNNAKEIYDTKYKQATDLINLSLTIQGKQEDAAAQAKKDALANVTVFANAITSGNMSLGNLSPEMAANLNKMELQAGLPMGFLSSLKVSAKDSILNINEKTGEVLVANQNGGFSVVQAMTPSGSGGTGSDSYTDKQWQSKVASAITVLNSVDKTYQTINGKAVTSTVDEFGKKISYSNQGDRLLSRQEMEIARQKVVDSVGGNTEVGYKLFNDAMNAGGFQAWGQ